MGVGKKKEEKGKREKEKSDLIESLLRTTRSKKLKPTIQVNCEPRLDQARKFNCRDAQLASSVGISYKVVVW